MWVRRGVVSIKVGLMAEAIAHAKTMAPPEGVRVRMLRPVNGPKSNTRLVLEAEFEDVDAYYANHGRPQPEGEWMKRWHEFSEGLGSWELYEVMYEMPCQGASGLWVDRRTRYCPRPRTREALGLWRQVGWLDIPGYSLRILSPRTSSERGQPIIQEMTAASLPQLRAAIAAANSTPEGQEWVRQLLACEEGFPTLDLLRVVE